MLATNQISAVRQYLLGGYKQHVALDGKNTTNPILLTLHGGPGSPVPFSVGCRGLFPEYTEHFIMVYWDQLGCGINNHPVGNSFSVENFADMAVDLIKVLKQEFPDNRLMLLGTSWGSVLATRAALRVPNLIDSVVIYGQVTKNLIFNKEVYAALESASIPSRDKRRLWKIQARAEHSLQDLKLVTRWIRSYTDGYQTKSNQKMPMGRIFGGMLLSPDYSLKDFVAVTKNGYAKNTSLWRELMQIDLSDMLNQVQVPYLILQGSTDIVSSTKRVAQVVAESDNTNLRFLALENNGHIPNIDGLEAILAECKKMAAR